MERTATDRKAAASGELTTDRKAGIARPVNRIAENIKEEGMVLELLAEEGLLKGKTIGVDVTTLEANAALRSIVRRDTDESYHES